MLSNNAVKLGVGKALIVKDKEKESNLIFTVFFRCISHFEDIKIKTCRRCPIPEVYEETVTKKMIQAFNSTLRRQKRAGLSEFKVSLVY